MLIANYLTHNNVAMRQIQAEENKRLARPSFWLRLSQLIKQLSHQYIEANKQFVKTNYFGDMRYFK